MTVLSGDAPTLTARRDQTREILSLQKRIGTERMKALRELVFPGTRRIGEARIVTVAAMEDLLELLKARAGDRDT